MADLDDVIYDRLIDAPSGQKIKSSWQYCVVEAPEAYELSKRVNAMINDKWKPLGGVSKGPTSWMSQAMVKK